LTSVVIAGASSTCSLRNNLHELLADVVAVVARRSGPVSGVDDSRGPWNSLLQREIERSRERVNSDGHWPGPRATTATTSARSSSCSGLKEQVEEVSG